MSRITCRIFCATIGARPMLGSGERAGGLVAPFRDPREKLEHAGAGGSDLGAGARIRAHREVFLDAELGKHAASLGHHDEPRARAPERGDAGEVVAVDARPEIARRVEDFPAPFAPIRQTSSPPATSRSIPFTARMPP